ncbi:MAG: hypothetical protein KDE51_02405, partial [Anaerolineales bacterium]|nr:hypothetical protein [Anaerolineales bacterium]
LTPTTCLLNPQTISPTISTEFNNALLPFNLNPDNPLELLSYILDSVDLVLGSFGGVENEALNTNLPLIDASPQDVFDELQQLDERLNELRNNPPQTLDDLQVALSEIIAADVAADGQAINSLDPDLRFVLIPAQGGNAAELQVLLNLSATDTLEKRLAFELGNNLPEFVGLESDGKIGLTYAAEANLALNIPLDPEATPEEFFNNITIQDSTGMSATLDINMDGFNITANLGPLQATADVTGTLHANASLAITETFPISDIGNLGDYLAFEITGPDQPLECGQVGPTPIAGDACAIMTVEVAGSTGQIGFFAPHIENPNDPTEPWDIATDLNINGILSTADLNLLTIIETIPELLNTVENTFAAGQSIPVVGDGLQEAANVTNVLNTTIFTPLADSLDDIPTPAAIEQQVTTTIQNAINNQADIAADTNAVDAITFDVTVKCGTVECADLDDPTDFALVEDIQILIEISDEYTTIIDGEVDLGLPGLPLGFDAAFELSGSWTVNLGLGLNRNIGPYLVTADEELSLEGEVALTENPGAACNGQLIPKNFPLNETATSDADDFFSTTNFSQTECIDGEIGFLAAKFYNGQNTADDTANDDQGNNPTAVTLSATVDLVDTGNTGKLTLYNFKSADINFRLEFDANVDLAFQTGFTGEVGAKLPSIVGGFHMGWNYRIGSDTEPNTDELELAFDHLYLNAGEFISEFVEPVVRQIKKITSPIKPVIDTLQAPLPGISELAQLTGGDPISLYTIAKEVAGAAGYDNEFEFIDNLIALIQFVNNLPSDQALFIPLGDTALRSPNANRASGTFTLDNLGVRDQLKTPDKRTKLINNFDQTQQVTGFFNDIQSSHSTSVTTGGLSFPFLDDAGQIFGLLLGQDATLIRYDSGILRATATVDYTFPPIFVGPVPISIGLFGTVEIRGRFAMGYDTYGLRQIVNGKPAGKLLEGIFIDDLDSKGVDVPEVQLIGTVGASPAVDVFIA